MYSLLVVTAFAVEAAAQTVEITAGDKAVRGAVVRVSLPQDFALRHFELIAESGENIPGSVTDGELIATVPRLDAHETRRYAISPNRKAQKNAVTIAAGADSHTIDVNVGRELWTRYHYAPDQRKPYLWPLNAPGEVGLTRDYPMGERVKTRDHPHHESFWSSYGNLNGADFWEYNERTGWQSSDAVTWGGGGAMAWIRAENIWVDAQRDPIVYEEREYRLYADSDAVRLMDLDVTLTARYGVVHFADTKEGGFLAYRIHDGLRERGGTGRMTNSAGGIGAAACWGKPARWLHYSGSLDDEPVGILAMDHPDGFRHPTYWHARDYGLVGANPFGLCDFTNGALNGDHELARGESITFRYRVLLHTGELSAADAEAYYHGFASPPGATIVAPR